MKCPHCDTSTKFDFSYCPICGYAITLEPEQPLPNWRQLPGFRSKTPWKMILASIIYLIFLLAIISTSLIFI